MEQGKTMGKLASQVIPNNRGPSPSQNFSLYYKHVLDLNKIHYKGKVPAEILGKIQTYVETKWGMMNGQIGMDGKAITTQADIILETDDPIQKAIGPTNVGQQPERPTSK